jgi:hypothetical protein
MSTNTITQPRLAVAVALMSASLVANADTLSGVGWGGPRQVQAVCYLFNAGPGTVHITSKAIYPEFGTTLPPIVYDSCATSIAPTTICAVVATIPGEGGNACRFVLSPSGANVRGKLEIRDGSREVLTGIELR